MENFVLLNSVQEFIETQAAPDLFSMFTQSISFYILYCHIIKEYRSGLEIIIFQWSDMLSDYTGIRVGHFSFKWVNKFFFNIIKTSPKFLHLVARSCADCTRGKCDSTIILTQ